MRLILTAVVVALLALLLQLTASFAPSPFNWGVHHYGFLGPGWMLLGAGLALVLGALAALAGRLGGGLRGGAVLAGVTVVLAILFWLGRDQANLLGDGRLLTGVIARGQIPFESAPLALALHLVVNRLAGSPDPAVTMAAVSVAAGAGYILLVGWFARLAAREPADRIPVFLLLVAAGLTRAFYGYIETYPLLLALVMLYGVLGVRYATTGKGWVPLAVALLVTVPVHVTAVALLPSYAWLVWITRPAGSPGRPAAGRQVAVRLGAPLAALVVLFLTVWGPGRFEDARGDLFGLALRVGGFSAEQAAYPAVSLAHLRDLLEEQLLLGPLAALLAIPLALLVRRRERAGGFLLVAGLPWWLASLVMSREAGAARDWDLFAAASIPLLLFVAWTLARNVQPAGPRRAVFGVLVAVSVFHLVPWVGVGANGAAAREHFRVLFRSDAPVSPFAVAYAMEQLANDALDRGDGAAAEEAFTRAWEATRNPRLGGNLGALLTAQGRVDDALRVLWQAADRDSTNEVVWFQLAGALVQKGDPISASEAYRLAIRENPSYLQAYLAAARLRRQQGEFAAAESLLVEARRRFPEDGEAANNLALLCQLTGRPAEAIELYRFGLERKSDDVGSRFNLGRLLLEEKKNEEAAGVFEEVLTWTPEDVEAWVNLGAAWERMGKPEDARTAYEHAKALAPTRPEPYFNLANLDLAAGRRDDAIAELRAFSAVDSTSREGLRARLLLRRLDEAEPPPK